MHFIDFLLQLFRSRLQVSQEDFQQMTTDLKAGFDESENKFVKILKSPAAMLVYVVALPAAIAGLNRLLKWIAGDQDGDGDSDMKDLWMKLTAKMFPEEHQNLR